MNTLRAEITSVKVHGNLSLVELQLEGTTLKSIVIETPATASYLKKGNTINVLFKETEVIIGKGKGQPISLRNILDCTITNIEKGVLLSKLSLKFKEHSIASIITTNAVEHLDLKKGEQITAMIKTNEIMLSD